MFAELSSSIPATSPAVGRLRHMQIVGRNHVGAPPHRRRRGSSQLASVLLTGCALLGCAALDDRSPGLAEPGMGPEDELAERETTTERNAASAAGAGSEGRPALRNGDTPTTTPVACDPEGSTGCNRVAPPAATCIDPGGCREVCVVGVSRVGTCAIR
ncbi:MAG: hypothetical protein RL033_1013 [Pseudomonadota bacterium]|jgi:hypothetical protein